MLLLVILTFKFDYSQTVAMKFIPKHGKSDKDIHNLRQEIEVFSVVLPYFGHSLGLQNVVKKNISSDFAETGRLCLLFDHKF